MCSSRVYALEAMLYSGRAQLSHIIYGNYKLSVSASEASKMAGCVFSACHFCTPDMGDNLAVKVCSAESNKRNRSGSQRQGKYREVLTEGSRI